MPIVLPCGGATVAKPAIGAAQKLGGRCAPVDAEHSMDPAYAAAIGSTPRR